MNEELIAKEKEALKDLHNEIWKPVKGFESIYEISNMGRVKALPRKIKCGWGAFRNSKAAFKKITPSKNQGQMQVLLHDKGAYRKSYNINSLVWDHFKSEARIGAIVPIDGNKLNLQVDNLAIREKKIRPPAKPKGTACYSINVKTGDKTKHKSIVAAAEFTGAASSSIGGCLLKKYGCKTAKGYRFEYA